MDLSRRPFASLRNPYDPGAGTGSARGGIRPVNLEPHHHLTTENEYVRLYYVEVPPHENRLLHEHDRDYIYVSLGPSVVNAILNKPDVKPSANTV